MLPPAPRGAALRFACAGPELKSLAHAPPPQHTARALASPHWRVLAAGCLCGRGGQQVPGTSATGCQSHKPATRTNAGVRGAAGCRRSIPFPVDPAAAVPAGSARPHTVAGHTAEAARKHPHPAVDASMGLLLLRSTVMSGGGHIRVVAVQKRAYVGHPPVTGPVAWRWKQRVQGVRVAVTQRGDQAGAFASAQRRVSHTPLCASCQRCARAAARYDAELLIFGNPCNM